MSADLFGVGASSLASSSSASSSSYFTITDSTTLANISTVLFTDALHITYQYDVRISPQERLAAEKYLMELRDAPEGLNLAFHIIINEEANEIRCFWAFNTVMHHLPAVSATMNAEQGREIYTALFSWIFRYLCSSVPSLSQGESPSGSGGADGAWNTTHGSRGGSRGATGVTEFLLNKHAQLMVVGIQECYPHRWPTVFDDVFALMSRSKGVQQVHDWATLYFLRLLECIDERVVSVRGRTDRGKEQRQRDMEVKDAMRERVMEQVTHTWYTILCDYRIRNPELSRLSLSVLQTYVEWIDIALLIKPDWINLLYFLTTVSQLRVAACECLRSIVEKKQLPAIKLETLHALNIVDALLRIVSMIIPPCLTRAASSEPESGASLLRAGPADSPQAGSGGRGCANIGAGPVGGASLRHRGTSPAAGGDEDNFTEVAALLTVSVATQLLLLRDGELPVSVDDALHAIIAQVILVFRTTDYAIREIVLPFLLQYVKSSALVSSEVEMLLGIVYGHTLLADVEADFWCDDLIEQRKALHNVCRLLFRSHAPLVLQHLLSTIYMVATAPSPAPSQNAEAALRYLYEIGESIKMERLRDANNEFSQLLHMILQSETLLAHPCSIVHLNYFEVLDRYSAFFVFHSSHVPLLLNHLLLMPCGITNPNERVRSRICYLFTHMVQVLKAQMAPHAGDVVKAMRAILEEYNGPRLTPADRRDLFEATGMLLSVVGGDVADGHALVSSVLQHMETLTRQAGSEACSQGKCGSAMVRGGTCASKPSGVADARRPRGVDADSATPADVVADLISYLSHLSKGMRGGQGATTAAYSGTTPERRKAVDEGVASPPSDRFGPLFSEVCRTVMFVLRQWNQQPIVRDHTGQFMHQMINMLPLPFITDVFEEYTLSTLLWMETLPELTKLLRLVFQFTNRSRSSGAPTLARLLPALMNKVAQVGDFTAVSTVLGVVSEHTREQVDVFRQYLSCIHAIAFCGALTALLMPPAADVLPSILQQLLATAGISAEFELPKQALQILTRLCVQWCGVASGANHALTVAGHADGLGAPSLCDRGEEAGAHTGASASAPFGQSANSSSSDPAVFAPYTEELRSFDLFVTQHILGYILDQFTQPSFDLTDAKNFVLVAECCALLKAVVSKLGEEQGLGRVYTLTLQLVGAEAARAFCVDLRDAPRVSIALKERMRGILLQGQRIRSGLHAGFSGEV